jgi:MinD-like ATPase involved in chromosome partitioning or flagellar assembly
VPSTAVEVRSAHEPRRVSSLVLHTVIPEVSAFKVSLACRQPVSCYAPHSKAALSISQLACEIAERTHQRTMEQKIA